MPVFKKKKTKEAAPCPLDADGPVKVLDKRVGMDCYRDFFTLKNFWKTVRRNEKDCGKALLSRYLNANPQFRSKYPKLRNAPEELSTSCSDSGFENVSAQYLKLFDDVITIIEEQPGDASDAITRLTNCGKMHKNKVEGVKAADFALMEKPFLKMVEDVLQDRFNDKAETLFSKFFQFCQKYMNEGFNA
ncbi:unnamed protein product [Bursaphelenchus xylophilus]|uniref:(pine wood nematode) hypothetical protein n=1 Tax=Bursaphelenchus xylophilus TaxID=6326 RepID=A0A1I7RTD6_BURXY|nr:unnamed protein product [Bursaphelenchus xylophilus]CAG9122491.1 unnamed protein product [Bursaphelenchus xylophilus]